MLATRLQTLPKPAPTPTISVSREEEEAFGKAWEGFKAWANYFGSNDWTAQIKDVCDKEHNLLPQTKKVRGTVNELMASYIPMVGELKQLQAEIAKLKKFKEDHLSELDNSQFNAYKKMILELHSKHTQVKEALDAHNVLRLQLINDGWEIENLIKKHDAIQEDLKKIPHTTDKERNELLQKVNATCQQEASSIKSTLFPTFLGYCQGITKAVPADFAEATKETLAAVMEFKQVQLKVASNSASRGLQQNNIHALPTTPKSPVSKEPEVRATSGRISPPRSPGSK